MAINLSKTEEQLTNEVMGKISLQKDKDKLGKKVVKLSKAVINLSKEKQVDLGAVKAQVVFVVDYSGSMRERYKTGEVQEVVNKMVPLGLTFDDNGQIECFRFSSSFKQFESIDINNYNDYVDKYIYHGDMGTTKYAPVLNEIRRQYVLGEGTGAVSTSKGLFGKLFGKKQQQENSNTTAIQGSTDPVFVVFVTDGDNDSDDKEPCNKIIKTLSNDNVFIQFIGIRSYSGTNFRYLRELDDLPGRSCDNTGFVEFEEISKVSEDVLYTKVLEQFADWLKVKGFN